MIYFVDVDDGSGDGSWGRGAAGFVHEPAESEETDDGYGDELGNVDRGLAILCHVRCRVWRLDSIEGSSFPACLRD